MGAVSGRKRRVEDVLRTLRRRGSRGDSFTRADFEQVKLISQDLDHETLLLLISIIVLWIGVLLLSKNNNGFVPSPAALERVPGVMSAAPAIERGGESDSVMVAKSALDYLRAVAASQ